MPKDPVALVMEKKATTTAMTTNMRYDRYCCCCRLVIQAVSGRHQSLAGMVVLYETSCSSSSSANLVQMVLWSQCRKFAAVRQFSCSGTQQLDPLPACPRSSCSLLLLCPQPEQSLVSIIVLWCTCPVRQEDTNAASVLYMRLLYIMHYCCCSAERNFDQRASYIYWSSLFRLRIISFWLRVQLHV